ncbi:MAG: homoprotocatechuate degradation operon regulator HpaR [Actinomycetota bacterium]
MRPFSASLPMALLQAREAAMRLFRPMLAEHDLTEQQWRVLRALTAVDEPIDAGALAERTFLLAPSLSRILANLVERRLISRSADPADQRRALFALTTDGVTMVGVVAPASEERYAAIEAAFGAERLGRLLDELHALAALDLDTTVRQETTA